MAEHRGRVAQPEGSEARHYTREAIAQRRQVGELLRQSRALIAKME
jgi:hypothetical protein